MFAGFLIRILMLKTKIDCGGEPFIQGRTVPYDPKYHEEWLRNYNISKQLCRPSRTNDTPRNYYTWDVPNQVFQNSVQRRDMPPMNNNSYVVNAPPMPNRNIGGVQPSSHACVYPNQMPAPQGIYAPTRPGYQGNGHNYQAVNPNGPGYQGYQLGPLAHQQGGGPNYQQQMAYQSGPNYPPRRPSYQEGGELVVMTTSLLCLTTRRAVRELASLATNHRVLAISIVKELAQ